MPKRGPPIRFWARIGHPLRILNRQPIRRQVIVAATILVVPLAAAVVWSAMRTVREREAEVKDQAAAVATT